MPDEEKIVLRGFKTELRPTTAQVGFLQLNVDAARAAYNIGLRNKSAAYDRNKENLSVNEIKKVLRRLKRSKESLLWMGAAIDRAVEYALQDLNMAYSRFFKWNRWCRWDKGGRKGKPPFEKRPPESGYPRTKKRDHAGSFSFLGTTVKVDRVRVPKCGWVRLKERGYLPQGRNNHRVTVSKRAGRWFVTVLDHVMPRPLPPGRPAVGIDVNLANFATLSDGVVVPNPCHIDRFDRKLRLWSRRQSRRRMGSKNWHKARRKVATVQYRCACARRSFLHELSTRIVRKYGRTSPLCR